MKKRKCRVTLVIPIDHDNLVFYSSCVGNPLESIYLPDVNTGEATLVTITVRLVHMDISYMWQFLIKSWSSLWYSKDFEL